MEKKTATRLDIARRAGTSVSVVSRAINNSGYVAKEKKERILKIAEELNYAPNPVAISLQKRRTKQILFYCKNVDNAFNIQLYKGMLDEAAKRGYLVLFNGKVEFSDIRNTLVDGIIMQDEVIAAYYLKNYGKNYHLPVVSAAYGEAAGLGKRSLKAGGQAGRQTAPLVEVDTYRVMEAALDWLEKRGHVRVAFGTPYPADGGNVRTAAFLARMYERGMKNAKDRVIAVSRRDPRLAEDPRLLSFREEVEEDINLVNEDYFGKGKLAARLFLERKLDATAVVGFNDEFSLGLIRGFQEQGIRVPEEISVMGIDGIDARKYVSPLLTTISLFPQEQGAMCVRVLLDLIEGKKVRHITHTGFRLMEGESVLPRAAAFRKR